MKSNRNIIGILALSALLLLTGACTSSERPAGEAPISASPESSKPAVSAVVEPSPEESEPVETLTRDDYGAMEFDSLAREADSFKGENMTFSGSVIQFLKGDSSNMVRLAVDGDSNQILYVEYDPAGKVSLREDDWIQVWGVCYGDYSYEAVMGNTVTLPSLWANDVELKEEEKPTIPEYQSEPFTLDEYYSSGRLMRSMAIESFEVTGIETSYSGDLEINYTVIGTVRGSSTLSFDIKCYDADGFLLDSKGVYGSVSDGERFKLSDSTYIPSGTVRLEFGTD